jgi:hypothetical protein
MRCLQVRLLHNSIQLTVLIEFNRKRNLRCDERKPACKRCIHSGRTCEGYVCVSTARKPTDVTPESILEFRQRCLPSREHPKKALVVLPAVNLETPKVLHSLATIASNGLATDDFMQHVIRAVLSHPTRKGKGVKETNRQREMGVTKFHEPVKDIFDLSKPEGCPVIRSAFMMQMYRILIDIMMSKGHSSDKEVHDLLIANSQGRRK